MVWLYFQETPDSWHLLLCHEEGAAGHLHQGQRIRRTQQVSSLADPEQCEADPDLKIQNDALKDREPFSLDVFFVDWNWNLIKKIHNNDPVNFVTRFYLHEYAGKLQKSDLDMAKTDPFSVAASQILCKLYCRPALGQFSNYNCRRALREQFLTASFAELCELTNSTRPRHDGPEFQLDPENVFRFLCHGFSKFAVDFYRAIQIKLLGTLFLLNRWYR